MFKNALRFRKIIISETKEILTLKLPRCNLKSPLYLNL